MTILVAYASLHASTAEIARQIADRLMKAGFAAVARPANQVDNLQPYQAVVLGSAVQDQAWLPEAAHFLTQFASELTKRPVWLFSTCAVGETTGLLGPIVTAPVPRTRHESAAVAAARDSVHFRDHHYFAGAFERGGWSLLGDLFFKVCGGSPGDDRDWRDINEWAARIAQELQGADRIKERRRLHVSVRGRP
jgi:menaquinone-dependent protoporphyrinogen oxidase